jgi:hypothetical protein
VWASALAHYTGVTGRSQHDADREGRRKDGLRSAGDNTGAAVEGKAPTAEGTREAEDWSDYDSKPTSPARARGAGAGTGPPRSGPPSPRPVPRSGPPSPRPMPRSGPPSPRSAPRSGPPSPSPRSGPSTPRTGRVGGGGGGGGTPAGTKDKDPAAASVAATTVASLAQRHASVLALRASPSIHGVDDDEYDVVEDMGPRGAGDRSKAGGAVPVIVGGGGGGGGGGGVRGSGSGGGGGGSAGPSPAPSPSPVGPPTVGGSGPPSPAPKFGSSAFSSVFLAGLPGPASTTTSPAGTSASTPTQAVPAAAPPTAPPTAAPAAAPAAGSGHGVGVGARAALRPRGMHPGAGSAESHSSGEGATSASPSTRGGAGREGSSESPRPSPGTSKSKPVPASALGAGQGSAVAPPGGGSHGAWIPASTNGPTTAGARGLTRPASHDSVLSSATSQHAPPVVPRRTVVGSGGIAAQHVVEPQPHAQGAQGAQGEGGARRGSDPVVRRVVSPTTSDSSREEGEPEGDVPTSQPPLVSGKGSGVAPGVPRPRILKTNVCPDERSGGGGGFGGGSHGGGGTTPASVASASSATSAGSASRRLAGHSSSHKRVKRAVRPDLPSGSDTVDSGGGSGDFGPVVVRRPSTLAPAAPPSQGRPHKGGIALGADTDEDDNYNLSDVSAGGHDDDDGAVVSSVGLTPSSATRCTL